MSKDMSKREYLAALARYGMKSADYPFDFGYVDVGIPGHKLHICASNAGPRRRDQLAYLLRERDLWANKYGVTL